MQASVLRRNILIATSLLGLVFVAVLYILYRRYGATLPPLAELREGLLGLLQSIPAPLYFIAFAILPAFGAPLTFFYLTALPVLGQVHPVIGVLLAWCALAMNMILSYWLAIGLLHPAIEWVIRHRHLKIPKINPANEVEITVAVRISPLPFPVQNYLLALGHARWRSYLFLSLPIQGCIGIAMMFLGESILRGRIGYGMLAIFAILLIAVLIKTIRNRLNRDPLKPID